MGEHRRRVDPIIEQAKSEEQLAREAWSAKLRAASASDSDCAAARTALVERAHRVKAENEKALALTTWGALAAAGKFVDRRGEDDELAKQRGDRPSRIQQVHWPEHQHGPTLPRSPKAVY